MADGQHFTGELQSEDAQKLYAKLRHFSPKDIEIIKEISTEAIDRALFETMIMFETSEDFIIGAVNGDGIIDLNYISDGLGGEYDQWIDEFSEKEYYTKDEIDIELKKKIKYNRLYPVKRVTSTR